MARYDHQYVTCSGPRGYSRHWYKAGGSNWPCGSIIAVVQHHGTICCCFSLSLATDFISRSLACSLTLCLPSGMAFDAFVFSPSHSLLQRSNASEWSTKWRRTGRAWLEVPPPSSGRIWSMLILITPRCSSRSFRQLDVPVWKSPSACIHVCSRILSLRRRRGLLLPVARSISTSHLSCSRCSLRIQGFAKKTHGGSLYSVCLFFSLELHIA